MRKNISLGDKAVERLEALQNRVDAGSASEIIREAIRLYEYFVDESEQGAEFYVKKPNEDLIKLKVFV